MGGAETEVTELTTNVLLEGAAWNFINIRRTAKEHDLPSEASFRFSRGVHPELAKAGVQLGLQLMAQWSDGAPAPGLVDAYVLKPRPARVSFSPRDVKRLLGIDLGTEEIVRLLTALEFKCQVKAAAGARRKPARRSKARTADVDAAARIVATAPPHRMDIGEGIVGLADILEEIARLVGYDQIPSTNMADPLPPQVGNPVHEWEAGLRDLLATLGFDEVVSYRLTSIEREARLGIPEAHVRVANPVANDKSVLRRSVLASVLDDIERNIRVRDSLAFFEIGPTFEPQGDGIPAEPRRLAMAMTGRRALPAWDADAGRDLDFFDLKGSVEQLLRGLHADEPSFSPTGVPTYLHPGKAASVVVDGKTVGAFGELHPAAAEQFEFGRAAVLVADFDLDLLRSLATRHELRPILEFPPVLEDIAIVLDADVPAERVESLIRQSGGPALVDVRLFDLYRGGQIESSKKSLAYSLTYQSADHTMTDAEAASIRNRIVRRLEQELGAVLRA